MTQPPKLTAMIVSRRSRRIPGHSPPRPKTASGCAGTTRSCGIRFTGMLTSPPTMIATISSSAASGLRCSLTRLVTMSSPNNIGSSKSSKRKAKSESKGKALMRYHRATPLQVAVSIISGTMSEYSRKANRAMLRKAKLRSAASDVPRSLMRRWAPIPRPRSSGCARRWCSAIAR